MEPIDGIQRINKVILVIIMEYIVSLVNYTLCLFFLFLLSDQRFLINVNLCDVLVRTVGNYYAASVVFHTGLVFRLVIYFIVLALTIVFQ